MYVESSSDEEEVDLLSAHASEVDALGNFSLIPQARRQIQAESDFLASHSVGKGKDKAISCDHTITTEDTSADIAAQSPAHQSTTTSTPQAPPAAIEGQGLEPPPSPRPKDLELDSVEEGANEGSLFADQSNESVASSQQHDLARLSSSSPSGSSSRTSFSPVRSTSSSSASSDERKRKLAFGLDGTAKGWKPHSTKSDASIGFEALKDSLKMTPIAKPGETVSQAIERVSKLRTPPRPRPEVC